MRSKSSRIIRRSFTVLAVVLVLVILIRPWAAPLPAPAIPTASPESAKAAIFDIDGTLTPGVFAMNTARESAPEAVRLLADNGLEIIYLSARFPWFSSRIPGWLEENGFPKGQIYVAQTIGDNRNPAEFKARKLKELAEQGWIFRLAYGDSSTDFSAYTQVGIQKGQQFALKREGEDRCNPGNWSVCLVDWPDYLRLVKQRSIENSPP